MKKLAILLLSISAVGITGAFAQGNIAFGGNTGFPILISDVTSHTNILGTASTPVEGIGPASVRVQLWIGTNGAPVSSMIPVGLVTNSPNTTLASAQGTFSGGNPFTLPAPFDGSFQIQYLYKAWSINTGAADYQSATTAQGGYVGQSALGTAYTPSSGINLAPATFGTAAGQIQGFMLVPVPEPGTIALAGLGAAALLLFRRRK